MLRAWWMDLGIDCGCFGIGQAVSPGTLLRDGMLALLALVVTAGSVVGARRKSRASAPSPEPGKPAGGAAAVGEGGILLPESRQ